MKFTAFSGTRRFITAPTTFCHLYPILGQINPVHASPSHLLKIRANIILPSGHSSSKWFPSIRFPHQNRVCTAPVSRTCYMPRPYSWFDHSNNIWWGARIIKLLITQSSPLRCYLVSLSPKYPPEPTFLPLLSEHVSHPCKTTGKIIVNSIWSQESKYETSRLSF